MREKTANSTTEPTVTDEAYMERFTNDQLACEAWNCADLVQSILFNEEDIESWMQDAEYEAARVAMASRVMVRRLTGTNPDDLRKAVQQRQLELLALGPETPQLPTWETLQ